MIRPRRFEPSEDSREERKGRKVQHPLSRLNPLRRELALGILAVIDHPLSMRKADLPEAIPATNTRNTGYGPSHVW